MTTAGDLLNQIVPALVRLTHWPGAALLAAAGAAVGSFAVLGLVHGLGGAGWVPLVLACVLAVPVLVLAWRRRRLERQVADAERGHRTVGGAEIVPAQGQPQEEDLRALDAALDEASIRTARFLPGVEAAQRAALRAAGGPVQAPYLRDDLRVTLVALVATLAAVPLGVLGAVVTAILVLTG